MQTMSKEGGQFARLAGETALDWLRRLEHALCLSGVQEVEYKAAWQDASEAFFQERRKATLRTAAELLPREDGTVSGYLIVARCQSDDIPLRMCWGLREAIEFCLDRCEKADLDGFVANAGRLWEVDPSGIPDLQIVEIRDGTPTESHDPSGWARVRLL